MHHTCKISLLREVSFFSRNLLTEVLLICKISYMGVELQCIIITRIMIIRSSCVTFLLNYSYLSCIFCCCHWRFKSVKLWRSHVVTIAGIASLLQSKHLREWMNSRKWVLSLKWSWLSREVMTRQAGRYREVSVHRVIRILSYFTWTPPQHYQS